MATHTQTGSALGDALRGVGYTEDAITDLLGDDAYAAGPEDVQALVRRLPGSGLGTAIALLFLCEPVTLKDAERALGKDGVAALEAAGLAAVGREVVPRGRVVPLGELLIAASGYSRGAEDPEDYVAAFSPTSRLCDALTPRRPVGRALDVGTGSGAQAILAARHARHVVATDVNPRALELTRLNAQLNGLTNIEVREGSLFDPVEGETFDLIVCNAPYVVSPEQRWTYRDAGGRGDEVSERVVREAARHLNDGGFATVTVSWVARDPDEPDEHVLDWVEKTGCDGWVLVAWEADPLDHASEWNADLASTPGDFGSSLDEWTRYLDELGVGWISEGAVVLHRRPGATGEARVDQVDQDEVDDASDQIERAFAARARLAELEADDDLLDERPWVAAELVLERDVVPGDGRPKIVEARVTLAEGTCSTVETSARALDVLASLDGERTLGEIVDEVAPGGEVDALELTRELLELGALELA